jgi:hypothetical protein
MPLVLLRMGSREGFSDPGDQTFCQLDVKRALLRCGAAPYCPNSAVLVHQETGPTAQIAAPVLFGGTVFLDSRRI